jgi:hypothetical protein
MQKENKQGGDNHRTNKDGKGIKTKIHGCVDGFVLKAVISSVLPREDEADFVSLGLDQ